MRRLIILTIALFIAAPAAQAQKKAEIPVPEFPTDSLGRILLGLVAKTKTEERLLL